MLNKNIRLIFLKKYYGYLLYSQTSIEKTKFKYDKYNITIHKDIKTLNNYIKKNYNEMHILSRKVIFTSIGRDIVEKNNTMNIFEETDYICKYIYD